MTIGDDETILTGKPNPIRRGLVNAGAGKGKSVLLRAVVMRWRSEGLKVLVIAPTNNVAASHSGFTIDTLIGYNPKIPGEYNRDYDWVLASADGIAHDEIMATDATKFKELNRRMKDLKQNTSYMGGVKCLLLGSDTQLPPVVARSETNTLSIFSPSEREETAQKSIARCPEILEAFRIYDMPGEFLFFSLLPSFYVGFYSNDYT